MLGQFKWVYAFFSPIGGYIADRFSRRLTICGSLFVWSAVTWWTGHVTTYDELLWARSLMGISEAFYIPAALALIADYHTGHDRSRAVGLHQMAIYCGVIVGGFGGYVADVARPGLAVRVHRLRHLRHALRRAARCSCCAMRPGTARPTMRRQGIRRGDARDGTAHQPFVHPARAVLHAAGAGGLGRARLDAGRF